MNGDFPAAFCDLIGWISIEVHPIKSQKAQNLARNSTAAGILNNTTNQTANFSCAAEESDIADEVKYSIFKERKRQRSL